jgi:hypothetical protein
MFTLPKWKWNEAETTKSFIEYLLCLMIALQIIESGSCNVIAHRITVWNKLLLFAKFIDWQNPLLVIAECRTHTYPQKKIMLILFCLCALCCIFYLSTLSAHSWPLFSSGTEMGEFLSFFFSFCSCMLCDAKYRNLVMQNSFCRKFSQVENNWCLKKFT